MGTRNIIIFALLFAGLLACSQKNKQAHKEVVITDDMLNESKADEQKVKKIFFNLPSPIELTQTVLQTNEPFNKDFLNPVTNIDNYSSSASLALNFGVYGADLCYCRVYDQLQESISYLSAIRKVTEKLQIPEDEGAETINRIESSLENRDSIFQIISETYASADGYLKENEREMTASFILVGGWVEGMYFAVQLLESGDQGIRMKIAEQKFTLNNLISMVQQYEAQNTIVSSILPKFKQLQEAYKTVEIKHEKPVVVTDQESKVTTIDNKANIEMSDEQLKTITEIITQIRSDIIK
jgi:hypothetical protein